MEEKESSNLDLEFKRYLQILRPYLGQLIDSKVITLCNAWIHRLSDCSEDEKIIRNKYVFSLCYQLARGSLEDPFIKYPPGESLPCLSDSVLSDGADDSSAEVECFVVNPEDHKTEVLFNTKQEMLSDTEYLSQCNDFDHRNASENSDMKSSQTYKEHRQNAQKFMCYMCPAMGLHNSSEVYERRTTNLIKKLRDIKTQNVLLHSELAALKEEYSKPNASFAENDLVKVNHATSAFIQKSDSRSTLKSLKIKLQEVQDSRNGLIDKISYLQELIDNINDMKNHEIEEIHAKHKLEIINTKEAIRSEVKLLYEKKIEALKEEYELKIDSLINKSSNDINIVSISKDDVIEQKNKIIMAKDIDIKNLNKQIEDLKNHLHVVLEKFIDKPTHSPSGDDSMKLKAEQLEKRLNKMEKTKNKCTRIYEAKVAQLQRDKHLGECSLQLQMVRQRAQVVNEMTDENQSELTTALDKLEAKYKDIVANVQATTIQRRMQDQIALESILQAACATSNGNNNSPSSNGQFSKTMRNQNPSCDNGITTLAPGNKVGNICIGNKSFGEDSLVTGYCLNGERMGELFERVYIPQRDNPGTRK